MGWTLPHTLLNPAWSHGWTTCSATGVLHKAGPQLLHPCSSRDLRGPANPSSQKPQRGLSGPEAFADTVDCVPGTLLLERMMSAPPAATKRCPGKQSAPDIPADLRKQLDPAEPTAPRPCPTSSPCLTKTNVTLSCMSVTEKGTFHSSHKNQPETGRFDFLFF